MESSPWFPGPMRGFGRYGSITLFRRGLNWLHSRLDRIEEHEPEWAEEEYGQPGRQDG